MAEEIKTIEWPNSVERFVAYFDIMGFTQMVFRESHDIVKDKMYKLKSIVSGIDSFYKTQKTKSIIRTVLFSDSIMMVSDSNNKDAASHIMRAAEYFQRMCFRLQIPLKGAIAHGHMTCDFDQSIYFGRPLIDAYLLQQELVLYGTILHDTAEVKVRDEQASDRSCVKYLTPFKSGKANHINLDWVNPVEVGQDRLDPVAVVEKLYDTVSGHTRMYVENTLDFVHKIYKKTE